MESIVKFPLTRGMVAIIDASMLNKTLTYQFPDGKTWTGEISSHKWHATPRGNTQYAHTTVTVSVNIHRNISLHRLLLEAAPTAIIDHRDGDGLNCRLANLRFATSAENNRNSRPKSGRRFKGTHKEPGRSWRVQLTIGRQRFRKRGFATEEEAAREYDRLALIYHGEFARLNFPGAVQ